MHETAGDTRSSMSTMAQVQPVHLEEPSAPKGKHRPGRFRQFADFVAARVRVNAQRLLVHIRVSKHHRASVRRTIAIHCRQNRSSPGVVTVYAGSSKLFPDLLENILWRV